VFRKLCRSLPGRQQRVDADQHDERLRHFVAAIGNRAIESRTGIGMCTHDAKWVFFSFIGDQSRPTMFLVYEHWNERLLGNTYERNNNTQHLIHSYYSHKGPLALLDGRRRIEASGEVTVGVLRKKHHVGCCCCCCRRHFMFVHVYMS
jgi:hypothetical protein